VGMVDAFILESLSSGVRAAAFIVPGALGALEGSFVLFGALFGLPPETSLAISLSKRVRELALGLPGLLVWHWIEGHQLRRRSQRGGGSTPRAHCGGGRQGGAWPSSWSGERVGGGRLGRGGRAGGPAQPRPPHLVVARAQEAVEVDGGILGHFQLAQPVRCIQ